MPLLLLGAAVACSDDVPPAGAGDAADAGSDAAESGWPTASWPQATPESRGLDAAGLEAARDYAFQEGKNTQAVIVIRGGAIVGEWYAEGRDESGYAASWSVAKSVTSALVGIAIEEGLIEGVEVSMADYLPEWAGTDHERIRLLDVLQMASGLAWNEEYSVDRATESDVAEMAVSRDPLRVARTRPVAHEPGTRFNYSSGDTMLLSWVLEQATGKTAGEYAEERLFAPLGIAADWWLDASGHTLTWCCLDMTPRDFAKLGLLYLHGGEWDGEQVVPAPWVEESLEDSPAPGPGYGYQWWLTGLDHSELPDDLYSARGQNGQYVYVVPSLDLVVIRNNIYDKPPGEAVASGGIIFSFANSGQHPEYGTQHTDSWSDVEFLRPILEAAEDG